MFKKTYQDNLRKLRKESTEEIPESIDSIEPFNITSNLSDEDVDPIEHALLYRKSFVNIKHLYSIEPPVLSVSKPGNFSDVEAILPSLIADCPLVDSDFLTGYYISKYHMDLPYVLTSFHAGLSKDLLTKGIYYSLLKREKKTKWQMLGCDACPKEEYKKILYNGVKKPCNIYCSNTINSINIQLSEVIDMASVNLYTCDIASKSTADVIKQFLLIREFLTHTAYILLRLPTTWTEFYTSMSTFILFCISRYKTVKLIKTPWNGKLYLLLHKRKTCISSATYMALHSYAKDLDELPDMPLISQIYFNINDKNPLIEPIKKAYLHTMPAITSDEAIRVWTNIIE